MAVGPLHKNGFGSVLISSMVAKDLGGKGAFFPEPEGLRFSASFPLPRPEQAPPEADVALPRLETAAPLAPLK
jgi:hypothetical protein